MQKFISFDRDREIREEINRLKIREGELENEILKVEKETLEGEINRLKLEKIKLEDEIENFPVFYQVYFWDNFTKESKRQIFTCLDEAEYLMNDLLRNRTTPNYCEITKHVGNRTESIITKHGTVVPVKKD